MERVLEELRKIEQEAERIRSEASQKAKEIIDFARRGSERLLLDAEKESEQVINKSQEKFKASMKERHEQIVKNCEFEIEKLREKAEKRKEAVVNLVFKALIGEKED